MGVALIALLFVLSSLSVAEVEASSPPFQTGDAAEITHPLDPLTEAEDWPVMGVHWFEFELMPRNFFETNPGMNVRVPEPLEAGVNPENGQAEGTEGTDGAEGNQTEDEDSN